MFHSHGYALPLTQRQEWSQGYPYPILPCPWYVLISKFLQDNP